MSRICHKAAQRIMSSALTPQALLEMFLSLEKDMEKVGAEGNFCQLSFIADPMEPKDGDLIPELHLSLRPFVAPVFMQEGEIINKEG